MYRNFDYSASTITLPNYYYGLYLFGTTYKLWLKKKFLVWLNFVSTCKNVVKFLAKAISIGFTLVMNLQQISLVSARRTTPRVICFYVFIAS